MGFFSGTTLSSLLPGAGDILSSAVSAREAGLNRDFNAQEAEKQREWTEEMSNTAYQRARADMEEAGINPVLALATNGGASAGSGASASAGQLANIKGGENLNFKQLQANIENTEANSAVAKEEKEKKKSEINNLDADTEKKWYETGVQEKLQRKIHEEMRKLSAEADIAEKNNNYYKADRIHKLIQSYAQLAINGLGAIGITGILKGLTNSAGKIKDWDLEDLSRP